MKLNKFDEFLLNKIFENKKETSIILSNSLKDLLYKIQHPISERIIKIEINQEKGDKATLIDLDEKDYKKFKYTIPSKAIDFFEKEVTDFDTEKLDYTHEFKFYSEHYNDVWSKYRTSTSVSKLVEKLFPKEYKPSGNPGNDRESFQNMVVAERKKQDEKYSSRFKIVDGQDINKYYSEDSYTRDATSSTPLGQSCMKYNKCSTIIDFYSVNKGVKLVILMSDVEGEEDKISGRALLWDISEVNGEEVDRKFMDRIYFVNEPDVYLFKEFAKRNGWLHKEKQNMDENEYIVDTLNNTSDLLTLKTTNTFEEYEYFPYLDTLKFYYHYEEFLSNSTEHGLTFYRLEETDGGPINTYTEGDIYIEYYDSYMDEDSLIWCDFGEDWRLPEDAIYLGLYDKYATQHYINYDMVYSDIDDDYVNIDDSVYSEFSQSYLYEHSSINVFTLDASLMDNMEDLLSNMYITNDLIDYIHISDLSEVSFPYKYNNEIYYFLNSAKNEFILATSLKDEKELKWLHKEWDKNKIFVYKGKYYIVDDEKQKDELIGQMRMFDKKNYKI